MRTDHLTFWGAALVAASVLAGASSADAAPGGGKGGKATPTPVVFSFGDGADDAIRSDGLGSFDGVLDPDTGALTFSAGERSLWLDFSTLLISDSIDPFGAGASAGWIPGASVSVASCAGAPGTSTTTTTTLLFTAPAPNGSGPTQWRLVCNGTVVDRDDTDADGVADTFHFVMPSALGIVTALAWLDQAVKQPSVSGGRGGSEVVKDDGWRYAGWFDMPWTADAATR